MQSSIKIKAVSLSLPVVFIKMLQLWKKGMDYYKTEIRLSACVNVINKTFLIKKSRDANVIFCKRWLENDNKELLINNTVNNKAIFATERHQDILGYIHNETTWEKKKTTPFFKGAQSTTWKWTDSWHNRKHIIARQRKSTLQSL